MQVTVLVAHPLCAPVPQLDHELRQNLRWTMQHKYRQPGEDGVTQAVDKLQQEVSHGGKMREYTTYSQGSYVIYRYIIIIIDSLLMTFSIWLVQFNCICAALNPRYSLKGLGGSVCEEISERVS